MRVLIARFLIIRVLNMSKIELKKAIIRGDKEIKSVELREPNAGEMRGLRLNDLLNADVDAVMTMLPRITSPSLQKHEINELNPVDLANLSGEIMSFFIDAG